MNSNIISLCSSAECTACGACLNTCPMNAIKMEKDQLQQLYPVINHNKCIRCMKCNAICPELNNVEFRKTLKVFAAWSLNKEQRITCASGGIAFELYNLFSKKRGFFSGVFLDDQLIAKQELYEKLDSINELKNSKYVYSSMGSIYIKIKKLITQRDVLFIGTPCQVAALINYCKDMDTSKLFTVDLICHGVCPSDYLLEHIKFIENKTKKRTNKLSFRDPNYGTYTFTFTLSEINGNCFYKRKVETDDCYQLGYHKSLIYREQCYHCQYAKNERCSDITLGDFSGLGVYKRIEYENRDVSCVLINSKKGEKIFSELVENGMVYADLRPKEEAFKYEKQLQHPSLPNKNRKIFVENYPVRGFEKSVCIALKGNLIVNKINMILHLRNIWKIIKKLIPSCLKEIIRIAIRRE